MSAVGAAPAVVALRSVAVVGQPKTDGSEQSPAEIGVPFDGSQRLPSPALDDAPAVDAAAPEERRSSGLSPPKRKNIDADYLSAHPRSLVPAIIDRGVASNAADFAADVIKKWTFLGDLVLDMMFGPMDTRDELSRLSADAAQEVIDWARRPDSRDFLEKLGRWFARNQPAMSFGSRILPESPLDKGEYWDMASGLNAEGFIRRERNRLTNYSFFDTSPFVTSYLREVADMADADNVRIMEGDILNIRKPEKPLAVLRTKNTVWYVPGFEKKLEEMVDWIAPGGRLVVQNDPNRSQRRLIIEKHGTLLLRLLEKGWSFEYSFTQARNSQYDLDTLIFTRPLNQITPHSAVQAQEAWDYYRAAAYGYGS